MKIASSVYNFGDYRAFLKDRYHQLKEVDPTFSFRSFSKDAGFGSPNYLKLVMDGKRNLSDEAIAKFAKGIRLDNHESEFFKYMVLENQCTDDTRKQVYAAKLSYLKELFRVKDLIPELYDYYHDWYHSAIREMARKGKVQADAGKISASLVPTITEEQASQSIELLKTLGFVNEVDGYLVATEKSDTAEPGSELAQKIYKEQMAELAAQSIYTQDEENFGCATVSLPADKVEEFKAKVREIVAEISQVSSSNPQDTVWQLNVQLFALTRKEDETTTNAA